jgi:osmotically-inducible protein OsmY
MWEDGYGSSHPLAVKVKTKGEIVSSVFDTVTSRKGASIMRTVESVFGVTQVQNGFKVPLNILIIIPN